MVPIATAVCVCVCVWRVFNICIRREIAAHLHA